jgi:hypothetical protein
VILRIIRGRASPDQLEALRAALQGSFGASGNEVAGLTRFHLGTRPAGPDCDILMAAFWSSAEAAAREDARGVTPLRIAERVDLHYLEAAHLEVDETILRHSETSPIAIRVATGRFSRRGSDIEMQELLRQRAPLIGEEMTEAYVGRRIVGRAVEVSFVSVWQQRPADRQLEDTFWPDIALRYDHFAVELYSTVPM